MRDAGFPADVAGADAELPDRVREVIRSRLRLAADVVCVPALDAGPVLDDRRIW